MNVSHVQRRSGSEGFLNQEWKKSPDKDEIPVYSCNPLYQAFNIESLQNSSQNILIFKYLSQKVLRGPRSRVNENPWERSRKGLLSLGTSYSLAAAAKSLQSCLTLCDPIDGSPPGSTSLGFSRQEHWSGLPFSTPMSESEKWKWCHSGKDRNRNRAVHSGLGRYLVTLQNQHQPHINPGGKLRQNCVQVQTTGMWDS